jgi:microcystin-dependent protein
MTGTETVNLTAAQMPSHYHPVHAISTAGTTADPTGALWAAASTGENQYSQNSPNAAMSANATTVAGSGLPHENMAPFQVVSFIIALQGIFPPQN